VHRFAGKVVAMPSHSERDGGDTFAVFVADSDVRLRIVPMWMVHSINGERVRGHVPEAPAVVPRDRTWTVVGSKGDSYTVTCKTTGYWTCTCAGFGYRRTCAHINRKKEEA
jgi:hypothetical protein